MKTALAVIAIVVLVLVVHTLDYKALEQQGKTRPERRSKAAETPAPQCRAVRNGRAYTGWVRMQRDGGEITGGCLYAAKGLRL